MTTIRKKSGILSWSEDNVNSAPSESGVFILRTSPTLDAIKFIEASSDLKRDLSIKIKDVSISDIMFFDWYLTDTPDEATVLANIWRDKYKSLE